MADQKRVAVIAVHGVADQKAGQTAREIMALLQKCLPGEPVFETHELTLPVASLGSQGHTGSAPAPAKKQLARLPHSEFARERFNSAAIENTFDLDFAEHLVSDHNVAGSESAYQTQRHSARVTTPSGESRAVDIYEMYWADLSRLGAGAWRILSELYQLIFHLGSLARHTVDLARAQSNPSRLLGCLSRTCAASEYALVGPIAMFNLALLLLLLLLAASVLTASAPWIASAVLLLAYNVVLGYATWWFWNDKRAVAYVCATLALACLGATAASLLAHDRQSPADLGLVIALAIPTALAAGTVAARGLARRNMGAAVWGFIAGAAALLILAPQLFMQDGAFAWPWQLAQVTVINAVANTAVILFLCAMLGWALLGAAQLTFAVCAATAHLSATGTQDRIDLLRAVRTGMLCMMVSTSMFAVITISLWALLVQLGIPESLRGIELNLWFDPVENTSQTIRTVQQFIDALLTASSGFFAPTLIALASLGSALFLAFLPSLVAEAAPSSAGTRSESMGAWLDSGLYRVGLAVGVIGVAYICVMVWSVAASLHLPGQTVLQRWVGGPSDAWVKGVAWALAASATSLLALGPALSKSLGRFRVVLDMALDVDNYFREHPRTSNPRARIVARYVSLLSHLSGKGYDKLVIVSHSQGTVITADLLRLWNSPGHLPHLHRAPLPPITLVTAGSPLAQLYRARFAHLYRWIDAGNAQWRELAKHFGLARWINVYRSGDYVGRAFWRAGERYAIELTPQPVSADRAEMCLGAGAHTHYFDDTAMNMGRAMCTQIMQD
jgi:hypothetical protein